MEIEKQIFSGEQENEEAKKSGWFRVDDVVVISGKRFRVKAVKPNELRLKLLPRKLSKGE